MLLIKCSCTDGSSTETASLSRWLLWLLRRGLADHADTRADFIELRADLLKLWNDYSYRILAHHLRGTRHFKHSAGVAVQTRQLATHWTRVNPGHHSLIRLLMILLVDLLAHYVLRSRVWSLSSVRLILLLFIEPFETWGSRTLLATILLRRWSTRWLRVLLDVAQSWKLRKLSGLVVGTCWGWLSSGVLTNDEVVDIVVVDLRAVVNCGVGYVTAHIVNNVCHYLCILLLCRCRWWWLISTGSSPWFLLIIDNFTLRFPLWKCTWLGHISSRIGSFTRVLGTLAICYGASFLVIIEIQCTSACIGIFLCHLLLLLLHILFFILPNLNKNYEGTYDLKYLEVAFELAGFDSLVWSLRCTSLLYNFLC